jgi:tetratricopeptide (TPR) repeat protein
MLQHLLEALEAAAKLGDQPRLGRGYARLSHCYWLMGDWNRSISAGQRARQHARELSDFEIEVITNFFVGLSYYSLGDYLSAADAFSQNLATLPAERAADDFGLTSSPAILARGWLVWSLVELGEFDRASVLADQAMRFAEAGQRPFELIQAGLGLGALHLAKGQVDQAIAVLERALENCVGQQVPVLMPRTASALAYAYALAGRDAEGVRLADEAISRSASMRLAAMHSLSQRWAADVLLLTGKLDLAAEQAERALAHYRHSKELGFEAWTLRVLAEIRAVGSPRDPRGAEESFRHALSLAERLGMRPLAARCHHGLAALHGSAGETGKAQEQLAAAEHLCDSMGIPISTLPAPRNGWGSGGGLEGAARRSTAEPLLRPPRFVAPARVPT